MGKNSLLKPTSKKKKSPSQKKDEEMTTKAKKTTPKAKAAAKAKPKAKAASKAKKVAAKAKPKAKTAPKAKPKAKAVPKAKKAAAKAKPKAKAAPKAKKAAPKKKLSLKEIMQKKFDSWHPEKLFSVSPDQVHPKRFSAPPFFSDLTAEETRRIKELLFKKFDMEEIKAAGKKAAAEKAAAEKAAAEKAAAEKAAAEKAAAEKAAAEKAAEEKAAEEKAAAEKAAEEDVSVSYDPPADTDTTIDDPLEKGMKYAVLAFVVLVALIIGSSAMNTNNYYVKSANGAVEIWQGKFSPMGEELLIMLPGVQAPEIEKDIYSKTDVFPLIFNYYVEKADTLLEVSGMPDFEEIRSYLNKALNYSISQEISQSVFTRLNNIDLMILMYKVDVAAGKGTVEGLETAKAYLAEAAGLNIDDPQADMIARKSETIDRLLIDLEVEAAKAAEAAAATE